MLKLWLISQPFSILRKTMLIAGLLISAFKPVNIPRSLEYLFQGNRLGYLKEMPSKPAQNWWLICKSDCKESFRDMRNSKNTLLMRSRWSYSMGSVWISLGKISKARSTFCSNLSKLKQSNLAQMMKKLLVRLKKGEIQSNKMKTNRNNPKRSQFKMNLRKRKKMRGSKRKLAILKPLRVASTLISSKG